MLCFVEFNHLYQMCAEEFSDYVKGPFLEIP